MPQPIGLHYSLKDSTQKPVILKSDAIHVYMKRDGMTQEDAEEFWSYNMEGSDSYIIAVDDMLEQEEIAAILDEQTEEKKLGLGTLCDAQGWRSCWMSRIVNAYL